jgi:glycosyltransferase involved in cell wall biosynthesis
MKKLLIISQMVDINDNHRGSFIDWINEFAKKYDEISVITVAKGSYQLPPNVQVYSLGKEQGISKIIQVARFYRYLMQLVPQVDGIFAHASPIFVIASWPVAVLFRKRIILWYLHRSLTVKLKIAEMMSYKIVTATKEGVTLSSNKIVETGHGIDIEKFETERNWNSDTLNILSVGRVSKIKNYETIILAAKILKDRSIYINVSIVGQPVVGNDHKYLNTLTDLILKLDLSNEVKLTGFVPYYQMPRYYIEHDIFVGALPTGGIDKAMLEAMASGEIILTSNKASSKYLGEYSNDLIFIFNNPEDLADKILKIYKADSSTKKRISAFLSESVRGHHNLTNLIDKILKLLP